MPILFLLLTSFAFAAFSDLKPYPCRPGQPAPEIELTNSDDLFFAGRHLVRAGREKEGVQCLNRAKKIAPAYLDVRLELLYAFVEMHDLKSAWLEADEFLLFPSSGYYYHTYLTYRRKIVRTTEFREPMEGFAFETQAPASIGSDYRKLLGEEIENEAYLKEAIRLKNMSRFHEARLILDQQVLPVNLESPTVWFYSGLVYYDLNLPALAEIELRKTLAQAYYEPDVILSVMRALLAQTKYQAAHWLIKESIGSFKDYGCFQLGAGLKQIFEVTKPASVKKLKKLMDQSLEDRNLDGKLCREIQANFF